MPRIRFTQAARADVVAAVDGYTTHALEIAPQFRQALRAIVARVEDNPKQFAFSSHGTRRALLRRFPYLVILANEAMRSMSSPFFTRAAIHEFGGIIRHSDQGHRSI